ncbi:unnamed protein product [Rhizoctonia solani]|uniref:Uncharacterized protein n=1 Tax=Rhizoctonia solani TaxID=456999 RepID=A0A8H3H2F6_9AGAM|nr:unnamed protein product [Rhizoctonia solani]
MNRFFRIPELVQITGSYGEPADNARLALTCRTLFLHAIPVAWASVSGVTRLLLLLEGAGCVVREDPIGKLTELKLLENLGEAPTSRFDFYANLVTSLEIFEYED